MQNELKKAAETAVKELIDTAGLKEKELLVVGCSTSEAGGYKIGTTNSEEVADAILDGLYPSLLEKGIFLAAQCCEHLNRALVMEEEAAEFFGYDIVSVVPRPKAGGPFATAVYKRFEHPVVVEHVAAKAGMDIGDTLIGMHLKRVAVPVRLSIKKIGEANLVCAKTRPKFIGGERACYDETLM